MGGCGGWLAGQLGFAFMEASVKTGPERASARLESKKAQQIVEAMRASVARRGAAASTFDNVAQEAGVSRGLLHYYFGSKERLLAEVVRLDCEIRMREMEERLSRADSVDALVESLVSQLEAFLEEDPTAQTLVYEMLSASRHSEDIREELAELYRRWRGQLAKVLRQKEEEGVVRLRGDADAVASVLFALGDGMELQVLSDPSWDSEPAFEAGIRTARFLLGADA
jgi:AcrR family transcriptional regulator